MSVLRDFYCCTFALLLKKGEKLFFSISFIMTSSILYLILGFQQNNDTNCVCVKRKYRGIRSKKTSKRDHRTANTIQICSYLLLPNNIWYIFLCSWEHWAKILTSVSTAKKVSHSWNFIIENSRKFLFKTSFYSRSSTAKGRN